jgi:hypothetical protein
VHGAQACQMPPASCCPPRPQDGPLRP